MIDWRSLDSGGRRSVIGAYTVAASGRSDDPHRWVATQRSYALIFYCHCLEVCIVMDRFDPFFSTIAAVFVTAEWCDH